MKAKLIIDLKEGKLEFEGSAALAKQVYKDFKDRLDADQKTQTRRKTRGRKRTAQKKTSSPDYELVSNLDLKGKGGGKSLKAFLSEYEVPTSEDLTLLLVYYLKRVLQVKKVTVDHIYTCFKELGKKAPKSLTQILYNQKNKRGLIDIKAKTGLNYQKAGEDRQLFSYCSLKGRKNFLLFFAEDFCFGFPVPGINGFSEKRFHFGQKGFCLYLEQKDFHFQLEQKDRFQEHCPKENAGKEGPDRLFRHPIPEDSFPDRCCL